MACLFASFSQNPKSAETICPTSKAPSTKATIPTAMPAAGAPAPAMAPATPAPPSAVAAAAAAGGARVGYLRPGRLGRHLRGDACLGRSRRSRLGCAGGSVGLSPHLRCLLGRGGVVGGCGAMRLAVRCGPSGCAIARRRLGLFRLGFPSGQPPPDGKAPVRGVVGVAGAFELVRVVEFVCHRACCHPPEARRFQMLRFGWLSRQPESASDDPLAEGLAACHHAGVEEGFPLPATTSCIGSLSGLLVIGRTSCPRRRGPPLLTAWRRAGRRSCPWGARW